MISIPRFIVLIKLNQAANKYERNFQFFDAQSTVNSQSSTITDGATGINMICSIGYPIVGEKHGGVSECISETGRGAEFVLAIPLNYD